MQRVSSFGSDNNETARVYVLFWKRSYRITTQPIIVAAAARRRHHAAACCPACTPHTSLCQRTCTDQRSGPCCAHNPPPPPFRWGSGRPQNFRRFVHHSPHFCQSNTHAFTPSPPLPPLPPFPLLFEDTPFKRRCPHHLLAQHTLQPQERRGKSYQVRLWFLLGLSVCFVWGLGFILPLFTPRPHPLSLRLRALPVVHQAAAAPQPIASRDSRPSRSVTCGSWHLMVPCVCRVQSGISCNAGRFVTTCFRSRLDQQHAASARVRAPI